MDKLEDALHYIHPTVFKREPAVTDHDVDMALRAHVDLLERIVRYKFSRKYSNAVERLTPEHTGEPSAKLTNSAFANRASSKTDKRPMLDKTSRDIDDSDHRHLYLFSLHVDLKAHKLFMPPKVVYYPDTSEETDSFESIDLSQTVPFLRQWSRCTELTGWTFELQKRSLGGMVIKALVEIPRKSYISLGVKVLTGQSLFSTDLGTMALNLEALLDMTGLPNDTMLLALEYWFDPELAACMFNSPLFWTRPLTEVRPWTAGTAPPALPECVWEGETKNKLQERRNLEATATDLEVSTSMGTSRDPGLVVAAAAFKSMLLGSDDYRGLGQSTSLLPVSFAKARDLNLYSERPPIPGGEVDNLGDTLYLLHEDSKWLQTAREANRIVLQIGHSASFWWSSADPDAVVNMLSRVTSGNSNLLSRWSRRTFSGVSYCDSRTCPQGYVSNPCPASLTQSFRLSLLQKERGRAWNWNQLSSSLVELLKKIRTYRELRKHPFSPAVSAKMRHCLHQIHDRCFHDLYRLTIVTPFRLDLVNGNNEETLAQGIEKCEISH